MNLIMTKQKELKKQKKLKIKVTKEENRTHNKIIIQIDIATDFNFKL